MALNINLNVTMHIDAQSLVDLLTALGDRIISQLSDAIAAASASADAAIGRVQADIASLKQQISDLQAQIASGGSTDADRQALADLKTKLDALDPTNPATI